MRARIIAEAKRLGYEPNPVASELMSIVRKVGGVKTGETIAFINTFQEDPTLFKRIPGYRRFLEGVTEQAGHYGYRLEEFRLGDPGMNSARIDQVLKARNIRGVLIGPRWFDEPEIILDWPAYSCVLIGETTCGAGIHRVCNHQSHTMELALTSLVALGYKRIGIELMDNYESVRHFEYLAGVVPVQRRVGRSIRFFMRVLPRERIPGVEKLVPAARIAYVQNYENLHIIPKLGRWVRQERLDALISIHRYDAAQIRGLKTFHGQPLGFALLETDPSSGYAGVNQHPVDIGRTAVNLLRSQLHAGERGVATRPIIALVEGEWIDGPTAPKVEEGKKHVMSL